MILLPNNKWHDLANPWASEPDLAQIAKALGNICRFNGNTSRHYSVAEHSIRVAQLVPTQHKLAALLHDAAEAFVGDMVSPLRKMVDGFNDIEMDHLKWIGRHSGVELVHLPIEVRHADLTMLATELRDLLGCNPPFELGEPLEARIGGAPLADPAAVWLAAVRGRLGK